MDYLKFDVIIVGAGPSGSSCAINLANTGLKIAVIDKAIFPRDKICGDGLSGDVINVLKKFPYNIFDDFKKLSNKTGSWGIKIVAPNLKYVNVSFLNHKDKNKIAPPGYVCKRIDFDNFLFEHLKKYQNITVFENFKVNDVIISDDNVIVKSKNQNIKGKLVVGADGAHSIISKKTANRIIFKKHYVLGLRVYYENVSDMHPDNFIELHFLKELLPGYFWIFPFSDNKVNVGLGMLYDTIIKKKINLKEKLIDIIENHPSISPRFKNARRLNNIQGYDIPLCSKKRNISGNRFLLLGDAASLVDPFTGEGISNAMISGVIAAKHITQCFENNNFSSDFMKQYDYNIYNKLWKELKLKYNVQKILKHSWIFNFIINKKTNKNKNNFNIVNYEDIVNIQKKLSRVSYYLNLLLR